MAKKRKTPFQQAHSIQFGLRVTEIDPKTSHVTSVVCRFCECFGREEKEGRVRRATKNAHYFTAPFRQENYRGHNERQHPSKWAEYESLGQDEKEELFQGVIPLKSTLLAHYDKDQGSKKEIKIDLDIIDNIIGNMFFDVDDDEDGSEIDSEEDDDNFPEENQQRRRPILTPAAIKQRAMRVFMAIYDEGNAGDDGPVAYKTEIKSRKLYNMVVEFASLGASFRLISRLVQSTRSLTGLACYSGCNQGRVASFLRQMCASNLQMIKSILTKSWTFALALDAATHQSVSYLDIRIRFCHQGGIQNCHLLALPMNERHTGQVMYDMVAKVMDTLRPRWKDSIVGVTTDGARNMTGRHAGMVTLLQRAAGQNFIRVWCGAHQLDLIMADIYGNMLKDDFFGALTAVIAYLRRQQNLIADMKSTCPKVALTRWLSMSKVMAWFKKNRIVVRDYLDEKDPECKPSQKWWVLMMVVHSFALEASFVFKQIQGLTTLVSQQSAELANLSRTLCEMIGGRGPLTEQEVNVMANRFTDSGGIIQCDTFAAPLTGIEQFVRGMGTFVAEQFDRLADVEPVDGDGANGKPGVLRLVGKIFLTAARKLLEITVERTTNMEGAADYQQLPPVMPQDLVKLARYEFVNTVGRHSLRLRAANYTPQQIEAIEEEHGELIRAYRNEDVLRTTIDAFDHKTSFQQGWNPMRSRFPALFEFVGGLATVFPGTATVEADFSRVRREKDIYRQSLSNFGLETVLHAQQHQLLHSFTSVN